MSRVIIFRFGTTTVIVRRDIVLDVEDNRTLDQIRVSTIYGAVATIETDEDSKIPEDRLNAIHDEMVDDITSHEPRGKYVIWRCNTDGADWTRKEHYSS
jgi:hypothetical protein